MAHHDKTPECWEFISMDITPRGWEPVFREKHSPEECPLSPPALDPFESFRERLANAQKLVRTSAEKAYEQMKGQLNDERTHDAFIRALQPILDAMVTRGDIYYARAVCNDYMQDTEDLGCYISDEHPLNVTVFYKLLKQDNDTYRLAFGSQRHQSRLF